MVEKQNYDIIFACIAMREIDFFGTIADNLSRAGYKVGFISFYQPGVKMLERKGYKVYSIYNYIDNTYDITHADIDKLEKKLELSIVELVLHEKLTFNRTCNEELVQKFYRYYSALDRLLADVRPKTVMQELGGFVAPLSLFYAAKMTHVEHLFIEPAMMKGRMFLTRNAIECQLNSDVQISDEVKFQVEDYIESYNASKPVAIPDKDKHHFRDAGLGKLLNSRNISKLYKKLYYKYILKQDEEYNAIANHVKRAVTMFVNRKRIDKYYTKDTELKQNVKYIYYPFHVPIDFQLTVRSKEFIDQIALLEYISRILPYDYALYVKEHPAAIGAYSKRDFARLKQNDNIIILHPGINSYDVIKEAKCVITVNSKVGAEALMQEKNVIVLGKAFYRGQGLTYDVDGISHLKQALKKCISTDTKLVSKAKLVDFLSMIQVTAEPGELYTTAGSNIVDFTNSVKKHIQ